MKNAAISESASAVNRSAKARTTTEVTSHTHPSRNLKRSRHCEPIFGLDRLVAGISGSKRGPRITFVYQDEEARTWARDVSQRITKLAGEEGVQASWWKIGDLTAPGILAGAVSSALRADLIVVASRAEGLPLPFYVWVNLWWPNRSETPGALIAIVGMPDRNASRSDKIGDYLRVVAEHARMDFLGIEKPVKAMTKKQHVNGSPVWNGHLHD